MNIFTLNNKNTMPALGLGTSKLGDTEDALVVALRDGISAGYRLIDTANGYHNEKTIGRFLKNCPIPRSELFVTSKLDDDAHSYDSAICAVYDTLDRLGTNYLDLFLIHNPNSVKMRQLSPYALTNEQYWIEENHKTWEALEHCVQLGLIRNIGVSNFNIHHLSALMEGTKIVPAVNQIKYCLGCYGTQEQVIQFCQQNGILVQAYSPFGKGFALHHSFLHEMSSKYHCSCSDIILNYLRIKGIAAILRSANKGHLVSNLNFAHIDIESTDMDVLQSCNIQDRWGMIRNPDTGDMYN